MSDGIGAGDIGYWASRAERAEARVRELEAERDAYKWGYEYLQDRMRSIGREGWAEDCDGEIKDRVAALAQGEKL